MEWKEPSGRAQHVVGGPTGTAHAAAQVPAEAVAAQVGRILESHTFAQAQMLRPLLQYLVDHVLEGRGRELKEYAIGVDVFERGPDFDPRIDTIVRVRARRLRAKLSDYYRGQGASDPVVLDVPKGTYVAVFRTGSTAGAAPASRAGAAASIVVLPFANLSGDAENEYFADGLTDEITSTLAAVSALRVVARTSAFQFKGRTDDIRRIGRELGVRTALEGTVRRDGERIRVTAQLIDIDDGFHLWSHIYDGALPGVFGFQEQTTRSIVDALRIRLASPDEEQRLRPQEPSNVEAYERFILAHYTLALSYIRTGSYAEAIAALQPVRHLREMVPDCAGHLGYALAGLGDADAAIDWLRRGLEQGCFDVLFIRDDPRFRTLHHDPRFAKIVATLPGASAAVDGVR